MDLTELEARPVSSNAYRIAAVGPPNTSRSSSGSTQLHLPAPKTSGATPFSSGDSVGPSRSQRVTTRDTHGLHHPGLLNGSRGNVTTVSHQGEKPFHQSGSPAIVTGRTLSGRDPRHAGLVGQTVMVLGGTSRIGLETARRAGDEGVNRRTGTDRDRILVVNGLLPAARGVVTTGRGQQ